MKRTTFEASMVPDEILRTLKQAWLNFDAVTISIQAYLLGKAIIETDSLLSRRLLRKMGDDFGDEAAQLIVLGHQFLDFSISENDEVSIKVRRIIDGMQLALDRIEGCEEKLLREGMAGRQSSMPPEYHQLNLIPHQAWQKFFVSILQSEMADGWFGRSVLSDAFEMLIVGAKPELFRSRTSSRHGRPGDIEYYKTLSVLHVYFMAGSGVGADASRRSVADTLGISFDTLKTWSDALRKSDEGRNSIKCATLAGKVGSEFRHRAAGEFDNPDQYGVFNGNLNIKTAERTYWRLSEHPLTKLANLLNRSRVKHYGARKR